MEVKPGTELREKTIFSRRLRAEGVRGWNNGKTDTHICEAIDHYCFIPPQSSPFVEFAYICMISIKLCKAFLRGGGKLCRQLYLNSPFISLAPFRKKWLLVSITSANVGWKERWSKTFLAWLFDEPSKSTSRSDEDNLKLHGLYAASACLILILITA